MISTEILQHYRCEHCGQWWSIGDGPESSAELYCPFCGKKGGAELEGYSEWIGRLVMVRNRDCDQWVGPKVLDKYLRDRPFPFRTSGNNGYRQAQLYNGPHPINMNPWHGGECPVDPDTLVLVRFGSGEHYQAAFAGKVWWEHKNGGGPGDIVRYAVLKVHHD